VVPPEASLPTAEERSLHSVAYDRVVKFGVFDHMDRSQDDLGGQYADRLTLIEAYDGGGLHCYHMAEHHGTPLGLAPSPNVFLAAAAQRSRRLRLGTLVNTMAMYHPLRLAEEVCMLDHLTAGRFEFGLGRGISPIELGFYGLSVEEANGRFAECREIVLEALVCERLTYHGTHYHFEDVPIVMHPRQSPRPPLWYGISRASSCEWAAANDVNAVMNGGPREVGALTAAYRAEWARIGKPAEALPLLGASRHIVLADSDAQALAVAEAAYLQWRASLLLLWVQRGVSAPHIAYPASAAEAIAEGYLFAGTPQTVRGQIAAEIDSTSINYMLCRFAFGQMPLEATLHSVELFAEQVLPALTA
jgi:alkanesulfonate monooxygenase SsuD/methylene tetrahydromethanopterin reductase-like flavin-dependent oxidoreductase (luciferase family)